MKRRHLSKNGAYYLPKMTFSDPDPRFAAPVTIEVLHTALRYLKWNKSDPDNFMRGLIKDLIEYVYSLDEYHENNFM